MKVQSTIKALCAALIAFGALAGATTRAHAGTVYVALYEYNWTTSYASQLHGNASGPITLSGSTYGLPAYMFGGIDYIAVATIPVAGNEVVGSAHVYNGGPGAGGDGQGGFLTNQPYAQVVNGNYILLQETIQNPPPAPPTHIVVYVSPYTATVASSSVPQ